MNDAKAETPPEDVGETGAPAPNFVSGVWERAPLGYDEPAELVKKGLIIRDGSKSERHDCAQCGQPGADWHGMDEKWYHYTTCVGSAAPAPNFVSGGWERAPLVHGDAGVLSGKMVHDPDSASGWKLEDPVVEKLERHACALCGQSGADRQRKADGRWYHFGCAVEAESDAMKDEGYRHSVRCAPPAEPDVESEIKKIADDIALQRARRLVRRAAVNRLIDMVRIEHLGLDGPNDRTSVEELTFDAIMRAMDLYVEGRPKASIDTLSMSLDTLEKMRVAGEK